MFTNWDARQVIHSEIELDRLLVEMEDVCQESGEVIIQQFALKQLLLEIKDLRNK